ncbi:hypothetical protein BB558_004692 [Smittium angustum]|uniref:Uncharacterized protein n=1 Tax=Smittium angustum TaxID=133377 RepID=A0A2U1J2L2_SMIAN|nr:hypothetical protein BB558_004692 [Smittium angustum]
MDKNNHERVIKIIKHISFDNKNYKDETRCERLLSITKDFIYKSKENYIILKEAGIYTEINKCLKNSTNNSLVIIGIRIYSLLLEYLYQLPIPNQKNNQNNESSHTNVLEFNFDLSKYIISLAEDSSTYLRFAVLEHIFTLALKQENFERIASLIDFENYTLNRINDDSRYIRRNAAKLIVRLDQTFNEVPESTKPVFHNTNITKHYHQSNDVILESKKITKKVLNYIRQILSTVCKENVPENNIFMNTGYKKPSNVPTSKAIADILQNCIELVLDLLESKSVGLEPKIIKIVVEKIEFFCSMILGGIEPLKDNNVVNGNANFEMIANDKVLVNSCIEIILLLLKKNCISITKIFHSHPISTYIHRICSTKVPKTSNCFSLDQSHTSDRFINLLQFISNLSSTLPQNIDGMLFLLLFAKFFSRIIAVCLGTKKINKKNDFHTDIMNTNQEFFKSSKMDILEWREVSTTFENVVQAAEDLIKADKQMKHKIMEIISGVGIDKIILKMGSKELENHYGSESAENHLLNVQSIFKEINESCSGILILSLNTDLVLKSRKIINNILNALKYQTLNLNYRYSSEQLMSVSKLIGNYKLNYIQVDKLIEMIFYQLYMKFEYGFEQSTKKDEKSRKNHLEIQSEIRLLVTKTQEEIINRINVEQSSYSFIETILNQTIQLYKTLCFHESKLNQNLSSHHIEKACSYHNHFEPFGILSSEFVVYLLGFIQYAKENIGNNNPESENSNVDELDKNFEIGIESGFDYSDKFEKYKIVAKSVDFATTLIEIPQNNEKKNIGIQESNCSGCINTNNIVDSVMNLHTICELIGYDKQVVSKSVLIYMTSKMKNSKETFGEGIVIKMLSILNYSLLVNCGMSEDIDTRIVVIEMMGALVELAIESGSRDVCGAIEAMDLFKALSRIVHDNESVAVSKRILEIIGSIKKIANENVSDIGTLVIDTLVTFDTGLIEKRVNMCSDNNELVDAELMFIEYLDKFTNILDCD